MFVKHVPSGMSWLGNTNDPFSPVQDLDDDLSAMPNVSRAQNIREGLRLMAACARSASWVNRFLVHAEFLLSAGKVFTDDFIPSAYSLFMEYQVDRDKYHRWLDLSGLDPQAARKEFCFDMARHRVEEQIFPNTDKNPRFRKVSTSIDKAFEFLELSMEASMAWWNMTDGQRQPWHDMCEFQCAEQRLSLQDYSTGRVYPTIRTFREFAQNPLMHSPDAGTVTKEVALHIQAIFRSQMARFQSSRFARKPFDLKDLRVPQIWSLKGGIFRKTTHFTWRKSKLQGVLGLLHGWTGSLHCYELRQLRLLRHS